MGNNFTKIFLLVTLIFFTYGCSRKEKDSGTPKPQEEVTRFTFRQFANNNVNFLLTGESAEVSKGGKTSVSLPELSFSSSTESIEVMTGSEGRGEIQIVPDERRLQKIIITGNVKIIYRDIKTGEKTMEGSCRKLTYNEAEKMLIMEGSPVIKRGSSHFSGDTVYYRLDSGTLEVRGNVNAQIYTQESGSD